MFQFNYLNHKQCFHTMYFNSSKFFNMTTYVAIPILLVYLLAATSRVNGRDTTNDTCTAEYSCSGCSDIVICKKTKTGFKKLKTINCKAPTPYCDYSTATCVSEAPLPCLPSDTFTCMQDGIFPDKSNCSVYHHCKESISFPYSCNTGHYFNSLKGECAPGSCVFFNCKGKHGVKIPHPGNNNYFAYCGDELPVVISRCEKGYVLNPTLQKCIPFCNIERHLVDIADCTKYYKCMPPGTVLAHLNCPYSYGFDPVSLRCVPQAMVPFCKTKNQLNNENLK